MTTPQQPVEHTQCALGVANYYDTSDEILSPFLDACDENDVALAMRLTQGLGAGAWTIGLNRAVIHEHLNLARQLRSMGAEWDARTVQLAARSFERVKWLIESGYDVNTGLPEGQVLLNIVIHYNNEASIRYLLEHGADPRLGTPLRNPGPPMSMRPEANSYDNLNWAASSCTPEIFALLLAHGAELKTCIPLHRAAASKKRDEPNEFSISSRIPMLEYLVGLGLDINALDDDVVQADRNSHWGTPLHYAIRWWNPEHVKWLLDHDADPDKPHFFGSTPRDVAKRFRHDDEFALLEAAV